MTIQLQDVLFNIDAETMEHVFSSMFEAGAFDQAIEFRRSWEDVWTPEALESVAAGKETVILMEGLK
jgi:hypothetical protein